LQPVIVKISPILPIALAIMATAFTFFCWLVGEQILGPLFTSTTPQMNENGIQVATGLRMEWLAIPLAIAIGLWVWAAFVSTRRQVNTTGGDRKSVV
jgi:hypothetical protein